MKQHMLLYCCLLLVGCKRDILQDIRGQQWNHERAIIDLVFENQVGTATIERDEQGEGTVSFMYNTTAGNPSQLTIKHMELSYGAQTDLVEGDQLVFDDSHTAQLEVTSKSGQKRTWKIRYTPFTDELVGTWQITMLSVYGGAWPEYGGAAAYADIKERPWCWESDGTGPVAEYDNTLTFTLAGITEEGDAYGNVYNDAGADGQYANFIFIDDPDGARDAIDVNGKYRMIPIGEGTWKRNARQGTITFSGGSTVSTGRFVTSGTEVLDDYNNQLTVQDQAFTFDLTPSYIWLDIYKDRERFVENAKKFWIQVKKVSEE